MCWTHPTDAPRLRSLKKITGAEVISVSQSTQHAHSHIECNFATKRGLGQIVELAERHRDKEITVILDHWWLERNYYIHCYGADWISTKCHILLKSGVHAVILPVDKDPGSNMKEMLAQTRSPGIDVSFINLMDNPLFGASESLDVTNACIEFGRQNNMGNVESYLNAETPFVRILGTYRA